MLKWLGLIVSAVFLWLTFREVQLGQVLQYMTWTEARDLGLAVLVYIPAPSARLCDFLSFCHRNFRSLRRGFWVALRQGLSHFNTKKIGKLTTIQ